MGFISTGNTLKLTAFLTQKGRDLLLNGSEQDITGKFFGLGDSDTNYNIEIRNSEGYVPDLTGDSSDCILSLANNVGIRNNVFFSDESNEETPNIKSEVRLKRSDDGKYYNVVDCFINLDSIGRYMLFHSADNKGNINASKVNNALAPIFTNMFTQVDLLNNPSETPALQDIDPTQDFDFEMMFDPNIYKSIVNTYLLGDDTVNQVGEIVSPIVITFSSRVDTSSFNGAGQGSIGIIGRELGYVYKPFDSTLFTFYNETEIENVLPYKFFTDENNQIINKFNDFTLASRLVSRNLNTGNFDTVFLRGDTNLTNISETNLNGLSDEIKNANQHLKLFKIPTSGDVIVNGSVVTGNSIILDNMGLVQKEILNLRDFIHISPYFVKQGVSNEYRTSKLTFNVYPKNNKNVKPATLNVVFKFNEDILLDVDTSYDNITDEGDKKFIDYEFVPTNNVFKNVAKTASFIRNNCGTGYTGSNVVYTVPKGTYTGSTQAIADGLATNDINSNGQTYANTNGSCTVSTVYYSEAFSGYVMKNDCAVGQYGSNVFVEIPQGAYSSTVSQYDANILASYQASILANAQGSCTNYPQGGGGCLLTGERIVIDENLNTKAVEDIKVGDIIYTAHEKTKELGYFKITKAVEQVVDVWIYITTTDGRSISCSPTHLFMVNGEQKLVTELKKGGVINAMVHGCDDFELLIIKDYIVVERSATVHKLEVADAHTYMTDNLIWHHNKIQEDPYDQNQPIE